MTRDRTVCIIPARGGSKGVPRKNLRPLRGRPLLAHSVGHALEAESVGRIIVSTDDAEIAALSRSLGTEVIDRPAAISGDTASSESALLHALEFLREREGYRPDLVVFLQATSPLRAPGDIDAAVRTLLDERADSLFSACVSHEFLWRAGPGGVVPINYDPGKRPRRQEMAPQYRENGSIFVTRREVLESTGSRLGGRIAVHEMSPLDSLQIDTEEDFALLEAVVAARGASLAGGAKC